MDAPRSSGGPAMPLHEHEFEAAPGLPEPLPPGETLLWQGAPDWRLLAAQAFHVPALVGYFAALLLLRAGLLLGQGAPAAELARSSAALAALAAVAVGLAALLAWLSARTTIYTLTDRRLVMRVGIVLSVTLNLPLACIERAALRTGRGRSGDIAILLEPHSRIAWLQLWPHVRPWRLARAEPALRALPDAAGVAAQLVAAWQAVRVPLPAAAVAAAPPRATVLPLRAGAGVTGEPPAAAEPRAVPALRLHAG